MALGSKTKESLFKGKPGAGRTGGGVSRVQPGLADFAAGEVKEFASGLSPYLPSELIGGTIPHISGSEMESVWNAASQACGTEKVHFCYSVHEGRIWYLACPSSALSSNPDSWCPLAAALPGNSEYWDKETVYLYEQEGVASALRWDPETGRMQVFLGAARTILPRVQSMEANFVTIKPEAAQIVPWRNMNLRTEKLVRGTMRLLVLSGLGTGLIALIVLVINFISINLIDRQLIQAQQQTEASSNELMINAYNAMQSDTIKHMVRIQNILDSLAKVDGTLVRYEVKDGKTEWEALVPPAFAADYGTPKGLEKDGRARIKNNR